jgi:chemotaxis signal transduction protein
MTEKRDAHASDPPEPDNDANDAGAELRVLVVARRGPHRLAVFADEADGVSKFAPPAPLPFAPPAVVGVVAVRGRMRTLIDPLTLLPRPADAAHASADDESTPTLALLLKGDEQLALAVEQVGQPVELPAESIAPPTPAHHLIRGTVLLGDAEVVILDPARLFEAVMRGQERRRVR